MLNLLAQDPSASDLGMMDVLMIPLLCSFAGVGLFLLGMWLERKGKKAPWKWIGLIPPLYAMYPGFQAVSSYGDPLYRDLHVSMGEKKMMFGHYGALGFPILAIVVIVCLHFFGHRIKLTPED